MPVDWQYIFGVGVFVGGFLGFVVLRSAFATKKELSEVRAETGKALSSNGVLFEQMLTVKSEIDGIVNRFNAEADQLNKALSEAGFLKNKEN